MKMTRVNISLSDDLLERLDYYKTKVKLNRSAFIAKAVEYFLIEVKAKVFEERKKKAILGIRELRKKIGPELAGWDATADIRKLRDTRWAGSSRWLDIKKK